MENLDLIILTTVVVILFLVFIIATFREIIEDSKKPHPGGRETGPRAEMMEFVGRLFSDDRIEPMQKRELLNIIKKKAEEMDVEEDKK